MIRSMCAELLKLRRPAVLYGAGAVLPLLAVLATALDFATATDSAAPRRSPVGGTSLLTTVPELGRAGGLTIGYTSAAGFLGLLVFVLFITSVTGEYGQGTIRVLLSLQPRRLRLLAGKLTALLLFTAGVLVVAELAAAATALVMAPIRGVATADWFSSVGASKAAGAYANSLLTATFFGTVGAAIGILARSTPVALGVGLAWIGPLEHIVQLTWSHAGRWFPGLVFDAVGTGGSSETGYSRGVLLAVLYAVAALVIAATAFARRDVTS